ncbi:MAG: hypothetical protein PHG35_07835 [Dehalococcoidales bacterium]|nr:hypothetical protein [Dehalococcoidales bacterium]
MSYGYSDFDPGYAEFEAMQARAEEEDDMAAHAAEAEAQAQNEAAAAEIEAQEEEQRQVKKWRPPEWDKIRNNIIVKSIPADGHFTSNHVVEAVDKTADAILKALRRKGVHVDGPASFTSLGQLTTLSNKDNTGTYTFIPDDTEASDGK